MVSWRNWPAAPDASCCSCDIRGGVASRAGRCVSLTSDERTRRRADRTHRVGFWNGGRSVPHEVVRFCPADRYLLVRPGGGPQRTALAKVVSAAPSSRASCGRPPDGVRNASPHRRGGTGTPSVGARRSQCPQVSTHDEAYPPAAGPVWAARQQPTLTFYDRLVPIHGCASVQSTRLRRVRPIRDAQSA